MKTLILTLFFTFSLGLIFCQNLFIVGNKSYKATKELKFNTNQPDVMVPEVSIIFFKDGGEINFSFKVYFIGSACARGKLSIYLDNGEVITCLDRGRYDEVNHNCSTIYKLTLEEVNSIIESNINQIRFELKCVKCDASAMEGVYSVQNISDGEFSWSTKRNDFSKELELFLD